jgi:hypothetical protein
MDINQITQTVTAIAIAFGLKVLGAIVVWVGGPGHLTRYRAAKPNPALKKVDEAFWEKFQTVSSGRELEVQRCYQK